MENEAFRAKEDADHVVPEGVGEFPEGWDVHQLLGELTAELGYSKIVDFGCGDGRLCKSFDPSKYIGFDINEKSLEGAKARFAEYRFERVPEGPACADIFLAYSVFLHMNDQEINRALRSMRCKWLIVAEILGREWRCDGIPPVYNRDLNEYVPLLRSHDLILHKHVKRPYKRYAESKWYEGKNTDISFLIFKKCLRNPLV